MTELEKKVKELEERIEKLEQGKKLYKVNKPGADYGSSPYGPSQRHDLKINRAVKFKK